MSTKVVLPRFDLPRDSTRIAFRALWGAGGLVVIATLVLGMALWHRRSVEIATVEARTAKIEAARRAAMAPPPAPLAPKVEPTGADPTPAPTLGKPDTTMAAVVPTASTEPAAPRRASSRARHGKASHGRATAHAGAPDAKSAGKVAGKAAGGRARVDDDFIDKLLSK